MNTMIMGLIYRSFKVVNLAYKNNIWMLDTGCWIQLTTIAKKRPYGDLFAPGSNQV